MKREVLSRSKEFQRIDSLPRKTDRDWESIRVELTSLLTRPGCKESLRLEQAQALIEIGEQKGGFFPLGVGHGKTLISLLTPYILDWKRPILFLPAALIQKTIGNQRTLTTEGWRVAQNIRMVSYDEMGRVGAKRLLEAHEPDGIIADEAHRLKNPKAAVTKRVREYMNEYPEIPFVALSGTMHIKSIKDFAHLAKWTHKERCFVPTTYQDLEEWSLALDKDIPFHKRIHAGPMLEWAPPGEKFDSNIKKARRSFFYKMSNTPGVVSSKDDIVGASLNLRGIVYQPSHEIEKHVEVLRTAQQAPDGYGLGDKHQIWAIARQLALGFCGVWDPRPPPKWLEARGNWAAFCRETLSNYRKFDTELEVKNAIRDGKFEDPNGYLDAWEKEIPEFLITPKDLWFDDTALNVAAKWMSESPGIVWVSHIFFGKELARRTGAMFFGQKGRELTTDAYLQDIHDALINEKDKDIPAIICSLACTEGLDLQKTWDRNLITSPMSNGKQWQQLLGRTHRKGHRSDEVTVDVMFGCIENWESMNKAFEAARATEDTMGQHEKLNRVTNMLPEEVAVLSQPGMLWSR